MKNYIIGIAGTKNSGKDTVASMINYIFAVGVTRASYGNYIIKKKHTYDFYKDRIIHFADGLKDALSIIYNIPRDKFDDRDAKDNMYYNIKSCKFVPSNIVENKHNVEIITIDRLKNFNINTILRCSENRLVYIKLRTLMQYFGTDVCRNLLSDDIWIRQTMNKAVNIAETRKLCIIPDVRFANDYYNNRIFVCIWFKYENTIKPVTLSFYLNQNNRAFISLHDFYFIKAFNTKVNCYFINKRETNICKIDKSNFSRYMGLTIENEDDIYNKYLLRGS